MLASTFSRPRWAMPMTASAGPGPGRLVEQGVEQHDGRLGALQPEALLADVAGVQEPLEHLRRVEPLEDGPLLVRLDTGRDPLDVALDPALLHGVLDVHVLDAQRPAVGVAQHVQDLVERGHVPAGQAVGHELPGQVPDGQAVGRGSSSAWMRGGSASSGSRWAIRWPRTRYMLMRVCTWTCFTRRWCSPVGDVGGRLRVGTPAHRLVGHAHGLEDLVVEAVLARSGTRPPGPRTAPTRPPG